MDHPQKTDPYTDVLKWRPSAEPNVHYFWACPVPLDMGLSDMVEQVIDCDHGNQLKVYSTATKVEVLYRLYIVEKPLRFMCRPFDHAVFWSYGKQGGPSKIIKYLYKDKKLTVAKWVDKDSYLSVIRTNHFANYDQSFWSR